MAAEIAELEAVLGALGVGIVVTDRSGEIRFANGAARRLLGCRRQEGLRARDLENHGIALASLVEAALAPGKGAVEAPPPGLPGSLPLTIRALPLPGPGGSKRVALVITPTGVAATSGPGVVSASLPESRELLREVVPAMQGLEAALSTLAAELAANAAPRERSALVAARRSMLRASVLAQRMLHPEAAKGRNPLPRSSWWWWGELLSPARAAADVPLSPDLPRVRADRALIEEATRDLIAAVMELSGDPDPEVLLQRATDAETTVFGESLCTAELRVRTTQGAGPLGAGPRRSALIAALEERIAFARDVAELHAGSLVLDIHEDGSVELAFAIPEEARAMDTLMAELSLERMLDEACSKRFPVTLGLIAVPGLESGNGWERTAGVEEEVSCLLETAQGCVRRGDGPSFRSPGGFVGLILADADEAEARVVWTRVADLWRRSAPVTARAGESLRVGSAQFPGARTGSELFDRAKAALLDRPLLIP